MSYLEINNLHMDYDNISIDFSASIEKGKTLVIAGHSGSGKSTVLRMIAGLLNSGEKAKIHLDNKDITSSIQNSNEISDFDAPIIPISAKTGSGIDILRSVLAASQHNLLADSDTTLVTNQRHIQALADSRASLLRVRDGLLAGLPTDLAAQDIREAIYYLGSIVGEISTDEVLGNIFRNFCIGK